MAEQPRTVQYTIDNCIIDMLMIIILLIVLISADGMADEKFERVLFFCIEAILVNLFLVLWHRVSNWRIFNILIYEQTRMCSAFKTQL